MSSHSTKYRGIKLIIQILNLKRKVDFSYSWWAKLQLKIQLLLKNYSIHLSMNFFLKIKDIIQE